MKIVFMGTPEFAVPTLEILINHGYDIVGVVTATDKLGGRGKKTVLESAVKKFAIEKGLNILQPPNLKRASFIEELRSLGADLQVVVAFRMLPVIVWDMPRFGTMNLHASLLPKYRGAAPINWAIIKGEKETGLTTFLLQHEIDTGNVLDAVRVPIQEDDTVGSLHDRMMPIGAELVLKSVQMIETGEFEVQVQDTSQVTHAPKIFHDDCRIDFNQENAVVYNFIRGLSPYPGAWTVIDGKELKIFKCRKTPGPNNHPGQIDTDNKSYLSIHTKTGRIEVLNLKMAGKKRMDVRDFLNGYKIESKTLQD